MDEYPELVCILDGLMKTLKDGEEGFAEAAKDVESNVLRVLFTALSTQRAEFGKELEALAQSLGEKHPETEGSALGAAHRGWIDLRSALASRNGHAILDECVRGEDSAVNDFTKALEGDLPIQMRNEISTQLEGVQNARDKMRDLRETWTEGS